MSDIYQNPEGQNRIAGQACRVAYTINNTQPVISTIIGNQPLFYMDCEDEIIEEEGLLEDADYFFYQSELEQLRKEIDSIDKFSTNFLEDENRTFTKFSEDKNIICDPASQAEHNIAELLDVLTQSRLASAYLALAEQYKVVLKYSTQIENAIYDRKNAQILINPLLSQEDQILLAARELRRHFQHRQGVLIHPLMFHPDNAVLINRAQSCDLIVSMVRIAWELQLADIKNVWQRIENSSMADLGRAFAREAYLDFRTINNGIAAAAVFETWFLSERCRSQDKILIQQMLSDHQGYVFDLENIEQHITPALIAALGEMPFGKNYLAEHALTIMEDPVFTDIRDRSNANFLWFIKFERTFRETEQELQNESHLHSGTRSEHLSQDITQDENYDFASKNVKEEHGNIVRIFPQKERTTSSAFAQKRTNKETSQNSEVIYLRHWSQEQ